MIFPQVFILTLFIFCTFAQGSTKNTEERIETLERKLAGLTKACEMEDIDLLNMEDIATNRGWISDFVSNYNSIVSCT